MVRLFPEKAKGSEFRGLKCTNLVRFEEEKHGARDVTRASLLHKENKETQPNCEVMFFGGECSTVRQSFCAQEQRQLHKKGIFVEMCST